MGVVDFVVRRRLSRRRGVRKSARRGEFGPSAGLENCGCLARARWLGPADLCSASKFLSPSPSRLKSADLEVWRYTRQAFRPTEAFAILCGAYGLPRPDQ
jgi:hypothetical protein